MTQPPFWQPATARKQLWRTGLGLTLIIAIWMAAYLAVLVGGARLLNLPTGAVAAGSDWVSAALFFTSFIGIHIALAIVLIRLYWLQIQHHDHFKTLATDNRIKLLPLPPSRGEIYDRNGVKLAENITSVDLVIVPDQVDDIDAVIVELQEILTITEDDINRFTKLKRRKRRFEQVPIRTDLSQQEMALFAVERHRFPGVDLGVSFRRHYPFGDLTAHVVGYIGRINEKELNSIDKAAYAGTSHIGKTGLEKFYEEELHGIVGQQNVEVNAEGRILRVIDKIPPLPGNNLVLNLDMELQRTAEQALGDFAGAVIVICGVAIQLGL